MNSLCNKDSSKHVKDSLDILGDKWSALLLKLLHDRPLRFCELESHLDGISSRTLTCRLDMLIEKNIIEKTQTPDTKAFVYILTEKGLALDEIIHAMARWGKKYGE